MLAENVYGTNTLEQYCEYVYCVDSQIESLLRCTVIKAIGIKQLLQG